MYQNKRPTCVAVIGWVWIIIGGLMCFSAVMGLFASLMIGQMSRVHPEIHRDMPAIFRFFPVIAVVQIGVAALGIFSGINFLKLKYWSRNVLELLTWALLLFLVGFMVFWVFNWVSMASGHGPSGFFILGAIMGVVITGIYGVPLGIMLKFLRGSIVKEAMKGCAEPDDSDNRSQGDLWLTPVKAHKGDEIL